ncbi:hypothetical protein [Pseudoxanthomonas sp. JBR18]|uniref:hypothetical protein n=1 Tax=Pseudoxanthomonas sp. JBR18 TaxID=2969308 RepID=UPI002306964D|nr:hypothetical protein [Pseudoxanthomonas sp. JBR18]WCE03607.1 hypothetical protein PJ250_16145 [Pseudoxanthomonas sp. JBR18]
MNVADLLNASSAGTQVEGGIDPDMQSDLLATLEREDPRMAALCRLFAQRQAQAAQTLQTQQAVDGADQTECEHDLLELQDRHDRLRRSARALRSALTDQQDRLEICAAALGACLACWGERTDCPHCAGRGRGGWQPPDPALYARLVAPAARRLASRDAALVAAPAFNSDPDRAGRGSAAAPLD